jgi:hypothetical protein
MSTCLKMQFHMLTDLLSSFSRFGLHLIIATDVAMLLLY